MQNSKVGIVILHWNHAKDTLNCLAAVSNLDYSPIEVLVVDNGSTEPVAQKAIEVFPHAQILTNPRNLGYTGGNNKGIETALNLGCEYVWLLNDDVIVSPDSLSALMQVAQAKPMAGFLGPMIYTREDAQCILSAGGMLEGGWRARHRGIGEYGRGQFDQVADVDYLSGCALLVSRQAIGQIGSLDDDFFAYHEDIEWCYRGKRAGFKVLFVPQAKVWHPDTRRRDNDSPSVTYYIARNSLLFAKKHRLASVIWFHLLPGYLRTLFSWSIRPRWRHKRKQRDALARALIDFIRGRVGAMPSQ